MYNCDLQCNEAQLWQSTFNCKEVLQRSTFYSQKKRRLNGRFIGLNTLFTQSRNQLLLSGTPHSRWHLPQQIPMVSLSTLIFHYCVPTSASIWTIDLISVVVAKTIILYSRLPLSLLLFQSGFISVCNFTSAINRPTILSRIICSKLCCQNRCRTSLSRQFYESEECWRVVISLNANSLGMKIILYLKSLLL